MLNEIKTLNFYYWGIGSNIALKKKTDTTDIG